MRSLPRSLAVGLVLCTLLVGCSDDGADDAADPTSTTATEQATTTAATDAEQAERPELPADRPIEVLVPDDLDPDEPAPLVVLLHGYGADGAIQTAYFGMAEAAAERGMLLVAPSGTEDVTGLRFWNATDACCARAGGGDGTDVDDVGYLLDVIDTVEADHAVDPNRVYLVGHSNGGFMSFRMACDHADVVAAIVSLAGATFADPADCSPTEPVATLQVHGTADETIEYDGGAIRGTAYPSAAETLEAWVANNGCDPEPDDPAPEPRQLVVDVDPATVIAHSSCDPGGHAELWTIPGGVHIPALTPDFSDQVLDFLLAHPKS